jgi:membrane fusion protein, copper/silver efflux system
MRIRLVALIPGLALAGIVGGGIGVLAGMRLHKGMAGHLPTGPGALGTTSTATAPVASAAAGAAADDVVIYQCGMHNPPYEQAGPGNCPLCGMPLQAVHVHRSQSSGITIDPVMVQNMGVRTAMPVLGKLQEAVRAVGTLTEPEESHREINLRVNGWIEKLYANQDGMAVTSGQPLFELYSPEITAAADELITARKATGNRGGDKEMGGQGDKGDASDLVAWGVGLAQEAARRKLMLLGLTEQQVAGMEKMERAPATVTIVSPSDGHISEKRVIEGAAVKAGDEVLQISDRHTMWLIAQVFEQQLGGVKVGEKVTATVDAVPGKTFAGKVDFIYPHLDPATRTAQVRVVLENPGHVLHQNMFAEARIEGTPPAQPAVLVPREAILDTGRRQMVFVALGNGHFAPRDVMLGRTGTLSEANGTRYVEVTGITVDDTVVTSGQFLLDSESRLEEARRKFMQPAGGGSGSPAMPGMPGM